MTIDEMLAAARQRLNRATPAEALHRQAAGATLVDIRPIHQRVEYGEIPGSIVIERNVLEWRMGCLGRPAAASHRTCPPGGGAVPAGVHVQPGCREPARPSLVHQQH